MQCTKCSFDNPTEMAFCGRCGSSLANSCGACGFSSPPGFGFCGKCGAKLGHAPKEAPSPQTYTPRHLAERILKSRTAIEGERKHVTVLFADLKGSLEILADRDPEDARKILDPVIAAMMTAVHRYEGTVNQVMGDGIMALFGAPIAHEDHAQRACYAALAMQEAIGKYAAKVRRTAGITLQIRIGLNSGEVVVRSVASDLQMDYSAVGQTTHLAARMEHLATPGSILLTPESAKLVEGYARMKSLGPVPIKGREEPVEVFELLGALPNRSRIVATIGRGLTRFVGREAETALLLQSLETAQGGQSQVVALVGEPGVGKSRLVHEFTQSHRLEGWLVLQAAALAFEKTTTFRPLVDLLKVYFRIEEADDSRAVREKVTGKLLALDRDALEPMLPAFLGLLNVPLGNGAPWSDGDSPERKQAAVLTAMKTLLLLETKQQPLLMIVEDLHWIDPETEALLDGLIESMPTAPFLLLVNYRPDHHPRWRSRTYYTQLRMDPLPAASAGELLSGLLGDDPSLDPLKTMLVQRTEGNPYFLEESVLAVAEGGSLEGKPGAYRLVKPVTSIQVPPTVQAVLAARVDRLQIDHKRLLQTASVIGRKVPFALLQAVSELDEDEVRAGLTEIQAAEFLYESSLFPDLEYTFKHALIHEVAYTSLLQDRRRTLHAEIVTAMEKLYADRLPDLVEELAHHALRGEAWEKVLIYARRAGSKLAAKFPFNKPESTS